VTFPSLSAAIAAVPAGSPYREPAGAALVISRRQSNAPSNPSR
jgi:hypothetical protein